MRVFTGSYIGNGAARSISIGARAAVVFALGDTAQFAAWYAPTMWCGRSNVIGASDSVNNGCRETADGFAVGSNAEWNADGVTYHYVALVETADCAFDATSYHGNATAGTVITVPQQKQIAALLNKRDSSRSGVLATTAGAAATASSAGTGTWIQGMGVGQYTITAENEVNELDGPGGLGEEVTSLVFYEAPNVKVGAFTGNGAAGRTLGTAGFGIKAAIVFRVTPGGASARIITDTMSGKTKPVNAAALQSNELSIAGSSLVSGSGTAMNLGDVVYNYILLGDLPAVPARAPAVVRSKGKQAVYLTGTSSYVDCGAADGALMINGPISTEWCGAIYPTAANNTECPLILRGLGGYGAANGYSWGMDGFRSADGAFAWAGVQAHIVVAERLDNAPDIRKEWRSGIILPFAEPFHLLSTHDGLGKWFLYLNGRLVKQRNINLAALTGGVFPLPNIQSVSGHRTVIGGRHSGGNFVSPQKMFVRGARVYNRMLTAEDVAVRHARMLLGSAEQDVVFGLAEEWDAANARGAYMPATVSSANNGAISGGAVVTL